MVDLSASAMPSDPVTLAAWQSPAAGRCTDPETLSNLLEDYARQGFAVAQRLVAPAEVVALRDAYDQLFESRAGWAEGDFFDMLSTEEANSGMDRRLPQLAWPSRYAPELASTVLHRAAAELACQILGPQAELVWEFAIRKPAQVGAPTPWHQDEASFTVGTPYRTGVSVWIPLQDTNEANGCMLYLSGSHLGPLLPHESVDGSRRRAHALQAIGVDSTFGVAVPLGAGDAVLHHSRTLHGAGPNLSGGARRALTLEFAVKSKTETLRTDFPWNHGKRTARDERAAQAMPLHQRAMQRLRLGLVRVGLR